MFASRGLPQAAQFRSQLQDIAAEDAVDSTLMAASAVNWNAAGHEVLSYEGPFGVGYGVAILHQSSPESATAETVPRKRCRRNRKGASADRAARRWKPRFAVIQENRTFTASGILGERHGVFVTIRGPRRELRGCVGTLTPRFVRTPPRKPGTLRAMPPFATGVFRPVAARELEHLRFEVSVLFPLEEVASSAELDPRRYGVVLATRRRPARSLLPDVSGIGTIENNSPSRGARGALVRRTCKHSKVYRKKFREEDRNPKAAHERHNR